MRGLALVWENNRS